MGMSTWDMNPDAVNTTSIINITPDDCYVLPGFGYQPRGQAAYKCEAGSFNSGWNKEPCMQCEDGYTTVEAGALNSSSCVIAPGWNWDPALQVPVPCDIGWYCPGLLIDAEPMKCPNGTTTTEARAAAAADCDGKYGIDIS
jgi:hypothetical protein